MEQALLQAGWSPDQVRKALKAYVDVDFPIPLSPPAAIGNHTRRLVADPLDAPRGAAASNVGIRWSISTLIVAFPVFVVMSRLGCTPSACGSI
jgi:hypothetical protein